MIYHQVRFAMKPDAPKDQIGVRAMAPDGKLLEAVGVPIRRADPGWVQIARLRQVLGVLQLV